MLANEKLSQAKWQAQPSTLSENALIATIVAAFLLLHILAGAMLQQAPASASAPAPQESSSLYD
jgi:hypothetical protein